jgi:hypothetical protein
MRLIDGLKLKGRPAKIPNCSRNDLPQFLVDMGYKTGAEIGVHKGEFTEKFCQAGLVMYAIDPWTAYRGGGRGTQSQARQDFLYGHAQRILAPYENCTIIRAPSMEAVKQFKDGDLDFVYIDADHSFLHIAQDLVEWGRKVRSGGVVSGHDYVYYRSRTTDTIIQVQPVVDAYVKAFEIKNFYIFGTLRKPNDKDDVVPSWMFIQTSRIPRASAPG